jgi:glycosyltransferase involved in cell wall biosynthesis
LIEGLRALGWTVTLHHLGDGFPEPTGDERAEARETLVRLPDDALTVVDGLALGAVPAEAAAHAERLRLVALVHHPLARETGLDPARAAALAASETAALAAVRRCVATSPRTAADLAHFGVAADRVGVARPGTDPVRALPRTPRRRIEILCVATLTPRKGHRTLLRALARLRSLPWRLTCVGSLTRDPRHARAVRAECGRLRLAGRVRFLGEVDGPVLAACYRRADLFALASCHEGYGMAAAEALAHGLPVVATRAGALADTVPTGAGLRVRPGSVGELAAALRRVIADPSLRRRLAAGARRSRRRLPGWGDTAAAFVAELERAASARTAAPFAADLGRAASAR